MPRDLYRELQTAVHDDEDFERALEIVDTIIAQDGADPTLLSARLCCLLETRAYAEARALMEDNNMVSSRPYSYAYCLYRVHALAECAEVINQHIGKGGDLGARMTLLQAQLLYRMEDYSGAEEAYEAIRASGDFAGDPAELEANLLAARSQTATTLAAASRGVEHESFDIVYNRACAAIGAGNLDAAWELLQVAETECRETLAADDYTDEEIAAEVTAILAQQGYVLHAMGREQEAMDRYNEILDLKPDPVVYAVVGNNIVCLKKEQKLFDSFKKAQKANDVLLQQKLTQGQKQGIAVNRALLFLYMGKRDQCRAVVDTLRATHPDDDLPVLVLAALAVREKKAQRGIDTLRDFLADKADVLDDGACQRVSLALAQILLNEGKRGEAVEALQLAPGGLAHEPAVVATIVSIFTSQGDAEAAFSLVQEAVDYWRSDEAAADHPGDAAGVARVAAAIARENAKLQLRHSRFQNAVALYEDMVRARPDDLVSLANLVVAEALIDAPAAARHARSLPAFEARALSADEVDNLESEPQRVFRRKGKGAAGAGRNGGGDEDGGDGGDEAGGPAAKGADGKGSRRPRQRKKRKPRLPKNFDPNVMPDPERWLPMQERSYYRGKKRRKGKKAGRGGQGVTNEEMANKLQESTAPANSNTGGRRMGKNKRRGRRR